MSAPGRTSETSRSLLEDLRQKVLTSYMERYTQTSTRWDGLDSKAQGTVAMVGILIAGLFALVERKPGTPASKLLLVAVSFLALVVCLVFSLLSARMRSIPASPSGDGFALLVEDLAEVADQPDFSERLDYMMNDHLRLWKQAIAGIESEMKKKARYLAISQAFLCLGLITIAAWGCLNLFG